MRTVLLMSLFLTASVVTVGALPALGAAPAKMRGTRSRARQARQEVKEMERMIRDRNTPPFEVIALDRGVQLRVLRQPDYLDQIKGGDGWKQLAVETTTSGRPVNIRALLPLSGHFGFTVEEHAEIMKRFRATTRFRLALVHEDGSHEDLGTVQARGLVTPHDLALRLKSGRNLLVMLPEHSGPTSARPAHVASHRSGRIVELIVGAGTKTGALPLNILVTLEGLGMAPYGR